MTLSIREKDDPYAAAPGPIRNKVACVDLAFAPLKDFNLKQLCVVLNLWHTVHGVPLDRLAAALGSITHPDNMAEIRYGDQVIAQLAKVLVILETPAEKMTRLARQMEAEGSL